MRPGRLATQNRAQAILYDDNMMNFAGIVPRGKVPPIQAVHCPEPLTIAQLEEALAHCTSTDAQAAAIASDDQCSSPPPPSLFYFFDFDDTLSLCNGVDLAIDFADCDAILARLFGDDARQSALVALLSALLQRERCFVLTANRGYTMVAHLLNLLLSSRGVPVLEACGPARFVPDQTVQFTPTGTKIRAATRLVEARGFRLVTLYS